MPYICNVISNQHKHNTNMKARAFETPIGTRVYCDKYKFAANQRKNNEGWQAYRVDCWQEEDAVFYAENLYEIAEQIEKHCAKLKRQEKKMIGAN